MPGLEPDPKGRAGGVDFHVFVPVRFVKTWMAVTSPAMTMKP